MTKFANTSTQHKTPSTTPQQQGETAASGHMPTPDSDKNAANLVEGILPHHQKISDQEQQKQFDESVTSGNFVPKSSD